VIYVLISGLVIIDVFIVFIFVDIIINVLHLPADFFLGVLIHVIPDVIIDVSPDIFLVVSLDIFFDILFVVFHDVLLDVFLDIIPDGVRNVILNP